ncbi:hypothetical protein cypCar_00035708, partial [Cyprinus carpio]
TTTGERRSLGVLFHVFLGYWRTDCALNVMATNSGQLSRGFVTYTNQEIHNTDDEPSDTAVPYEVITVTDGSETPKKKNKKHKKHKSKKKRKKRKGEKESSSESGVDSDGNSQTRTSVKKDGSSNPEADDNANATKNCTEDKDQLLEIAKANAAAMCAKAGMPIPESLKPKAILQLPLPTPAPAPLSLPLPLPVPNLPMNLPMGLPGMPAMPNMTMNAAMASMTAATMTAALSNMGALASMPPMPPLPTITNKPPSAPTPNLASIEEKCKQIAESKEEMSIARPHVSDDDDDDETR